MCDDGDEDKSDSTGMPCDLRQRLRKKIRALCYSGHEEVDMMMLEQIGPGGYKRQ